MPFKQEQAEEIKKQLLEQVEKLPNENKDQIKKHIETLNEKQLEDFLKQNNIQISESGQPTQQTSEKSIFEQIINNELPSFKITENKDAIAILELNPLSKGHCLIIPKQKTTIDKISKPALSLAEKIAKKIKTKLKPEDVKIEPFVFQDYPAINIIPVYKDKELKKEKVEESELIKLQNQLKTKEPAIIPDKKPKRTKKLPEISFRIP